MKIALKNISDIKPYPGNPRLNDDAVDAVARSIEEFGFRQPIVVDADGIIVAGHTRYKAALKLGLEKVPIHVATDLTPEQIRAYRIANNKTAELAEWNYDLLPIELEALKQANYDLGLLGFDPDALAKLLDPTIKDGLCDPDEVPAPPDEAVTQPGDLWLLGDHRLLCGDSSKPADVDRPLGGAAIHLVNTDPPYNVRVEPRSNNAIAVGSRGLAAPSQQSLIPNHQGFDLSRDPKKAKRTTEKLRPKDRPLANDFVSDEAFEKMLDAWFGNAARVLAPGRAFYIWGGWSNLGNYPSALERAGLFWHQQLIWVKNQPVLCRKDFMLKHEWCFYGWREGAAHTYLGPNNATDVWDVTKVPSQRMIHLTEKPVELAIRAMQYSSREGENVLDLFGGSGSTLIAAEQTGRKAFSWNSTRSIATSSSSATRSSPARRRNGSLRAMGWQREDDITASRSNSRVRDVRERRRGRGAHVCEFGTRQSTGTLGRAPSAFRETTRGSVWAPHQSWRELRSPRR